MKCGWYIYHPAKMEGQKERKKFGNTIDNV
jgi:hypothetical protein